MKYRFPRLSGTGLALFGLGLLVFLALASGATAGSVSAAEDASKPFIVKIHADWCGTCTRMNPTFEALEAKLGDRARVVVLDVTDREAEARSTAEADRLGIRPFFDRYKGKTGTVGVLDGRTRDAVTVMKGETDVARYEAAVAAAAAGSPS